MEYLYNEYEKAGYNLKAIENNRNSTIIFHGFDKLLLKLNPDNKTRLLEVLEKCKSINKFDIIISDQASNLKKYEYESWYKNSVSNNYGIWVGNGVADQNIIKTNIGFKKNNNEVSEGYGIVIKNNKTNLVNLVQEEGDLI